jgi:CheY-like chemotaxis protein
MNFVIPIHRNDGIKVMPIENWKEKPRVLIVDDDDEFISDMKILLSSEFEVNGVTGTRQAKEMLDAYHPDCLLLDLNMPAYFGDNPGLEGLSFLKHIKSRTDDSTPNLVPVIILTARNKLDEITGIKGFDIASCYRKPPDIRRLKTAIWNIVENINNNVS